MYAQDLIIARQEISKGLIDVNLGSGVIKKRECQEKGKVILIVP